jgi:hypothetical protein
VAGREERRGLEQLWSQHREAVLSAVGLSKVLALLAGHAARDATFPHANQPEERVILN